MEKLLNDIYTAGFIDGEGTITLTTKRLNSKFRIPVVSASSTTRSILEFLQNNYGGHISKHKIYQEHHKQSWSWKINYNNAIFLLERIYPYLKEPEKRRRAKLIITDYKIVTPRNGKYTKSMEESKLQFEKEFFHPSNALP